MRPLCLRGSTTQIEEIDNKKGLFAQLFEPKLVKLGKMAFLRIFQQQNVLEHQKRITTGVVD